MGTDRADEDSPERETVLALVPRRVPGLVVAALRRFFVSDARVRVVVERRSADRRRADRRSGDPAREPAADRRRIRGAGGRRVGEQRAELVPLHATPALPPEADGYAEQLTFAQRRAPGAQGIEDRETAHLVIRLQEGDPAAYDEIYERYLARVYGYVRVALRDDHEAEDVTHEVFLAVLQALPAYRVTGAPFRTWLFRIARNQVINHMRKHRRVDVMESEEIARRLELDVAPGLEALRGTGDADLLELVQALPLSQRQVVVLRYAMEFDVGEIAEILDRTPNAVSQLQQRAFATLRARLVATGRHADTGGERLDMRMRARDSLVARTRRLALTY